jgi:hypothetical protein
MAYFLTSGQVSFIKSSGEPPSVARFEDEHHFTLEIRYQFFDLTKEFAEFHLFAHGCHFCNWRIGTSGSLRERGAVTGQTVPSHVP